jgi:hypothetical protein
VKVGGCVLYRGGLARCGARGFGFTWELEGLTCSVPVWVGARALREERKGAGVLLVKRAPESGVGVFDTNIELYNESGDGDGTWRAGGKEAWTCRHRTPAVRVQKAKIFHLSIGIFLALSYIMTLAAF